MTSPRDMYAKGKEIALPTFSDNVYTLEKDVALHMEIIRTPEIHTLETKEADYLIPRFTVREVGVESGVPAEFDISLSMHRMDAIGKDGKNLLEDYRRDDHTNTQNYHVDEKLIVERLIKAVHGAKVFDGGISNAGIAAMLRTMHGTTFTLTKVNQGENTDGSPWFDFSLEDIKAPAKKK